MTQSPLLFILPGFLSTSAIAAANSPLAKHEQMGQAIPPTHFRAHSILSLTLLLMGLLRLFVQMG